MAWFEYTGMDRTGNEVREQLEAADEYEAQKKARALGYFVTNLREIPPPPPRQSVTPSPQERTLDEQLLELLRAGQKLEAVRRYRDVTGAQLVDAKHAVERLAERHGIRSSGCTIRVGVLGLLLALGLIVAWIW